MKKTATCNEVPILLDAKNKIDRKTKPPGSLGLLESMAIQLCDIQKTLEPGVEKKRILVFAASHGITEEGVSAYPATVTAQMMLNFARGGAAINTLTRHGKIQLRVVDVGVDWAGVSGKSNSSQWTSKSVGQGTRNFLKEPAMTHEECEQAIQIGRQQAQEACQEGIQLLGIGEMGIGNTTSAAALLTGLLNVTPETMVGRGTGVNEETLTRKIEVVREAVKKYRTLGIHTPLDWLACVGGYEIAAMTGVILECTRLQMACVVDGFIATAAATTAFNLEPQCRRYSFFSHRSAEQGHGRVLEILEVDPILNLKMRLGEGTGVALAMPVIEAAAKIMNEMATFESAGVSNREETP